ncbi:MAG: HAD hydrolase family protein [Pseudomonadota bacterium]
MIIIFTDLDDTLLDTYTHSFERALPALEFLKQKAIPLILCSSKTKREIEFYRKKLGNNHPFISENGGGINYPAASSGVLDSLDSGFRRNDELAASGGEYNPKRFK